MTKTFHAIAIKAWTSAASFLALINLRRKRADVLSDTAHASAGELNETLVSLKNEFEFLSNDGYRKYHNGWRPSLYFEDSPICRKKGQSTCHGCVLMGFVPERFKSEVAPCRKIALKQTGETLEDLYRTATNDEIEAAVQGWLISVIGRVKLGAFGDSKLANEDAA